MDVLGDILRVIRLRGSVYFNACFCSPWGMTVDTSSRSAFHLIVKGDAWFKIDSSPELIKLSAGDIIFLPKGAAHSVLDKPDSECLSAKDVVEAYQNGNELFGGDAEDFNIICGYVEFDHYLSHPFFESLPEYIHINTELRSHFIWLDSIIRQVALESQNKDPGSDVLIDKFTEILFIQIIRVFAREQSNGVGYLAALGDRPLSKALSLIHCSPNKNWSINQLASEVSMSRSSFYSRFNEVIGIPPMKYLFEWRMLLASQKLKNTQKPIAIIAEEVGYYSDSAFQKAFKRFYNFTPASLRK